MNLNLRLQYLEFEMTQRQIEHVVQKITETIIQIRTQHVGN